MPVFNAVDCTQARLAPGQTVAFIQDKKTGAVLVVGRVDSFTDSAVRVVHPLEGPEALMFSTLIRAPATKLVIIGG